MFLITRLKSLPRRKILSVLKNNGFYVEREGAKHTILYKKDKRGKVVKVTSVGRHREIILPIVQSIIRQTDKSREEFLS